MISDPNLFLYLLIVIFSSLSLVRVYYRIKSGAIRDGVLPKNEGLKVVSIRWVLGIPLIYATGSYCFFPGSGLWMYLPLPWGVRLLGFPIGGFSVFLIAMVHRELGVYFSSTLVIRAGHKLVQTGPYRYVRHPMYSSYLTLFIGAFLFLPLGFLAIGR